LREGIEQFNLCGNWSLKWMQVVCLCVLQGADTAVLGWSADIQTAAVTSPT